MGGTGLEPVTPSLPRWCSVSSSIERTECGEQERDGRDELRASSASVQQALHEPSTNWIANPAVRLRQVITPNHPRP